VSAAASAPLDEAGVVKKAKMAAATPTEEVSATKKGKKASAGTGSKAAKPPKAKKELFEASSATGNASDAVVSQAAPGAIIGFMIKIGDDDFITRAQQRTQSLGQHIHVHGHGRADQDLVLAGVDQVRQPRLGIGNPA
jgi:hypothetical protein